MRSFENSLPRYARRKSPAKCKNICSASHGTTWPYQTHGLYTPTLLPTPMHNCLCLVKISTPKLKNLSTALVLQRFCKSLHASISKLYRKKEQHTAYLETSVSVVVGVVKKLCSHQKRCGGMGFTVVQQACS